MILSAHRALSTGVGLWFMVVAVPAASGGLPDGYWPPERAQAIIDRTGIVELAPDLSHLGREERAAIDHLLAAGRLLHELYERQNHAQAAESLARLRQLSAARDDPTLVNLLTLFRLFRGPIATTLENERVPFLPVTGEVPGRNVYPADASREALAAFLDRNPGARREFLHPRSVVRATDTATVTADLAALAEHPLLDGLHPGLALRIAAARRDGEPFYAVPYSVAYAESLLEAAEHVRQASELLRAVDPDFSAYLRLRARDLLTDDYEAGDAAWVLGRFGNLNAEIGSYETYDDELFGAKTFFALSVLVRDPDESRKLSAAIGSLQQVEDRLPYDAHRQVRGDIPIGVYNVVADFGQARGTNGASILPNDGDHARKYGRRILIRNNLLSNPTIMAHDRRRFEAATARGFHGDFSAGGESEYVMWHEIGHYLGVSKTRDGRDLKDALQDYDNLLEEMKADLVSLFSARVLQQAGHRDDEALRAIYAAGIKRVLRSVKPRRDQPYGTMHLMQWNYFLEHGLLRFDARTGVMSIEYDRYHEVVAELLAEVLALQAAGDPTRAAAFVERYGYWHDDLHEVIAAKIRDAIAYRFLLVRYHEIDAET